MKNSSIILLISLIGSVILNFNTGNNLPDLNVSKNKALKKSQQRVENLKLQISNLKDSIKVSESNTDTIIKYRYIQRNKSSKKIEKIKELTSLEADSIWHKKYNSKKESLINAANCDSLYLEYRSLTDLYNESIKKSKFLKDENLKQDTTITELGLQNVFYKQNEQSASNRLKNERFKKWVYLLVGVVGGIIYSEVR